MKYFVLGLLILTGVVWAQVPQSQHIWIVTEENHSYESVIGNPGMPYFNHLAAKYAVATQYYAEEHNSISALMWLVAGQPITGNNQTTSCYNVDNVARHIISHGLTWRSYQEDLPYPGFTGISNLRYVRRHNPIIDFTDTCAPSQADNSVPFTQLAIDVANHSTPNYAYITPNLLNDAHDGPLTAADLWLSQQIPVILALPEFQPGGDGIMFIVWDEADLSSNGVTQDNRCAANISNGCGGRVATLVIGPQVKPGYKSSTRYDHANLLRTVCDALGFVSCPGAGTVASPMADIFNSVNISTPFANSVVASPVHIQATASNASPIVASQVYVDGVLKLQTTSTSVDTFLPMTLGRHNVVVQSWDSAGGINKRGTYITTQLEAVIVTNPFPNALVGSSVSISATAGGKLPVGKMQVYVDGNSRFQSSGGILKTSIPLSNGPHTIAIQASDSAGNLTSNKFAVTSASPAVQILSPAPNAQLVGPLYVSATTMDPTPVTAVQIYLDNTLVYQVSGTGVQATIPVSLGTHSLVVQEWNQAGATYKKGVTLNVVPVPITFFSPKANALVNSPVSIAASAPASSPVQIMQIYIDNVLAYQVSGQTVSKSFSMPSGQHYLVVKGWDSNGNNWLASEYVNVK